MSNGKNILFGCIIAPIGAAVTLLIIFATFSSATHPRFSLWDTTIGLISDPMGQALALTIAFYSILCGFPIYALCLKAPEFNRLWVWALYGVVIGWGCDWITPGFDPFFSGIIGLSASMLFRLFAHPALKAQRPISR